MDSNRILKKITLIGATAFFIYIIFLGFSNQEENSFDISHYIISDCQETQNNYYSKQLTAVEKENYVLLCKRIESFTPGIHEFSKGLTAEEFDHIWRAISLEKPYFYVYYPLILTQEDIYPKSNDGITFAKCIIHFAFQEEWKRFGKTEETPNWQIQEDEECIKIVNLEEYVKGYVEVSQSAIERYKNERLQIDEKLNGFYRETTNMKGLQEKLNHYQEILIDNFSYDLEAQSQYENSSGFDGADAALYTRNIGCVLTGKGTCVGFAAVVKWLCEKDNIDAFIAIGEYRQEQNIIGHAWIGIKMKDGLTIYFDPTKTVSQKKVVNYYTKEQMQKMGYSFYDVEEE